LCLLERHIESLGLRGRHDKGMDGDGYDSMSDDFFAKSVLGTPLHIQLKAWLDAM
jgi:hypothetical protein